MVLSQEKLDVSIKTRSNLFNWRGQFTPEFVEYILKTFADGGGHVLDPFSGSGTVLQESARIGLKATGFEINPSAFAMSDFFHFCNIPIKGRNEFCDSFEAKLRPGIEKLNGQAVYVADTDYRKSYLNLLKLAREIDRQLNTRQERCFWLNILFMSERDKKSKLRESINKSFAQNKQYLLGLPLASQPIAAYLQDARCSNAAFNQSFDLVFTSPPYINVFNYHQNYRAIIEAFNYDVLRVAQSEFGSNRKNRGNRFKTVIQYCLDMEQSICAFGNVLKTNGKIVLVLGRESNVRGVPFYNSRLVMEILQISNGFSDVRIAERKFMNKFGEHIKEDLIIATRNASKLDVGNHGRIIAVNHLKSALNKADGGIRSDVKNAILEASEIESSPLFNPANIYQ